LLGYASHVDADRFEDTLVEQGQTTRQDPQKSRAPLIVALVALVLLVAVVALVVWAATFSNSTPPQRTGPGFERFEPGWSSAMAKAGVEATFPAGPVDLTQVSPTGSEPFEATFTAEEITALLNVYRYDADLSGQSVSFARAQADFPKPGVGALAGTLSAQGSRYSAEIEGPVTYSATGIDSPGATSLKVEGFTIGGVRRRQASDAVIAYLNLYLRAAPGLTIEDARIVADGVYVKGSAPARLEHPAPAAQ